MALATVIWVLQLESNSKEILIFLQLHLCVQYEVLEAAQLAIESLNGVMVEGIYVKVRWSEKAESSLFQSDLA